MTVSNWPSEIAAIASRRSIGPADVLGLRAICYGDGAISRQAAGWLFALDRVADHGCAEWKAFFLEALTDFIVRQEPPSGHISEVNAQWLIVAISEGGVPTTANALELLVRCLECATAAPPSLSAFALRQVSIAVVEGTGPLARGRSLEAGVITRDDVEILRRVLFAAGNAASIGVSREEADVLFDLNDRTKEANNDPAWSDLFVKAIASFLMAARGYVPQRREEALRREAWLDAPAGGIGDIFGDLVSTMLSRSLKNAWSSFNSDENAQALRNRALEAETAQAEVIDADEVKWLADRIGRDGVIHANERVLLSFLREESPDIHPSLRTLLDTAA